MMTWRICKVQQKQAGQVVKQALAAKLFRSMLRAHSIDCMAIRMRWRSLSTRELGGLIMRAELPA
jgi:hypothetical protein